MQRRVLNIIKDIWETLKKEIVGPKIKSGNINFNGVNILNLEAQKEYLIENIEFFSKNSVKDLHGESKPKIYEAVSDTIVKKISTIDEKFFVSENNMIISNIDVEVEQEIFGIEGDNVNNLDLGDIRNKINTYYFEKRLLKCYNSKNKIIKIPKRVYGKKVFELSKNELDDILKKMKIKFPKKDFSKFKILSVYKKIPVDSVKNIKYYKEQELLELYFGEKSASKLANFIILENRITLETENFFL